MKSDLVEFLNQGIRSQPSYVKMQLEMKRGRPYSLVADRAEHLSIISSLLEVNGNHAKTVFPVQGLQHLKTLTTSI